MGSGRRSSSRRDSSSSTIATIRLGGMCSRSASRVDVHSLSTPFSPRQPDRRGAQSDTAMQKATVSRVDTDSRQLEGPDATTAPLTHTDRACRLSARTRHQQAGPRPKMRVRCAPPHFRESRAASIRRMCRRPAPRASLPVRLALILLAIMTTNCTSKCSPK